MTRFSAIFLIHLLAVAAPGYAQQNATGNLTLGQALAQDFEFQVSDLPAPVQKRIRDLRTFCTERESEINFLQNFATITDLDGDRRPEFILNLSNVCLLAPSWFCKEDGSCQTELWTTNEKGILARAIARQVIGVATLVEGDSVSLQYVWSPAECGRRGANSSCGEIVRLRDGKTVVEFVKELPLDRF